MTWIFFAYLAVGAALFPLLVRLSYDADGDRMLAAMLGAAGAIFWPLTIVGLVVYRAASAIIDKAAER